MLPLRLLIGACLLLACGPALTAPLLRVCMTDVPHEPWRRADGSGLDFQLLKDFARLSGWQVELHLRPGRRCLLEIEQGDSDATVGLSHTPDRALWARFPMRAGQPDPSLALRLDSYHLYALRSNQALWNGRRLPLPAGLKPVLVQGGHSVALWLREQGQAVDESPRSVAMALQALDEGLAELAALPRSEADAQIARGGVAARRLDPALLTKPYFVVFSEAFARRHEAALPGLWKAFDKASRTPAYAAAAGRR